MEDLKKIQLGRDGNGRADIAEKIKSKIKNIMDVKNSPPEPLKFSGDLKYNWRNFRRQFEEFLNAPDNEQKSSEEKVSLLLSVIGEDGLYLYQTFVLDDTIRSNISLVLACFESHCKKKRNLVHERFMFQQIVLKSSDGFEAFLKEIKFKIKACDYGSQENSILRDRIVCGVDDITLQLKLIENEVKLEQAIKMCRSHYKCEEKDIAPCKEEVSQNSGMENSLSSCPSVEEINVISASDVKTISSDSEAENSNLKISFCVGGFPCDSLDGTPEASGVESRSVSPAFKLQISNVHTLSDSESIEFPAADKKVTTPLDSGDENDSSEAPRKYSRIKTGSPHSKKKPIENGKKRKAESPERERKKKKSKKNKRNDEIEDVADWSDNVYDSDADSDKEVSNKMTPSQKKVFQFFNTATAAELLLVPTCTEKKINSIIASRPYENWKDLVHKVETAKHLTGNVLNCALDVLKTRTIISKLMEKCLNLAISTEKAISAGETSVKEQPSILSPGYQLKSYQMVGLNWLVAMHHQKLSGILADEMGLGKTIQVIAFLSYLHETGEAKHPHLIVVPATTLENWAVEFSKWSPSLRVVVYHGHPDDRKALRVQWFKDKFQSMDVIITTYNIIASNYEEKKMFRIISLDYVVFDEAHMLKNMNAQRYSHLFSINARKRILLTGTPLQNSLLELMSLLNFVMPDMFADKIQYIKTFFSKNNKSQGSTQSFEQNQVDLAKRIMKPFVLRRLKDDVLQDLPTKTSSVERCPLTEDQKAKYDEFTGVMRECAEKDRDNYNYMSSFMQLRRLANHPLACRYIYQDDKIADMAERLSFDMDYKENDKERILEDLTFMSDFEIHNLAQSYRCIGKFKLEDEHFLQSGKFKKLDEMLPSLKAEGHRVLIFSQFVFMLDILEEYLRIRSHEYLRLDGSTNSLDRQELIDNYNEDSNIFIFLLTTRAGGIGINLTTADRVIIHDVDFNPYNDKQAEDRCHRLGQTKPVHITRLISEGTVEEYIYAKAQQKLNLEQELIGNEESEENKNIEDLLKEVLGINV